MSSGAKTGLIVGAIIGLLVIIGGAALFLGSSDSSSKFSRTGSAITSDDGEDDGSDDEASGDGGTSAVGAATMPDGYALIEGDGVSIGAPDDWQPIAADDFAMDADDFAAAFPDAPEGMLDQGAQFFEQGAVLVAFEVAGVGYPSNLNILDVPGEAPLGLVETQAEAQIESLNGALVSSDRVDLPVGEALRIEYTLDVALPDGSTLPSQGVQYFIPIDGRSYVITVSADDAVADLADAMVDTFRVT
jgi:hypothetical protein